MVASKLNIFTTLQRILLIIIGIGFSVLSTLAFQAVVTDFNLTGLIVLSFFILFGFSGLLIGLSFTLSLTVDIEKKLIIEVRCWFFKTTHYCEELAGCRPFTFRNKWGANRGFFLQTQKGRQIAYNERDFVNFNELTTAIKLFVPVNKGYKRNDWRFTDKKIVILTLAIEAVIRATVLWMH